ncbi:MAG: hypothetical protein ACFE8A_15055 [Candidatus Hodarchaeota archaeon]
MNIWIVDSDSGVTLLYKPYIDLAVDEDLVSGLLTALNQLTMVEFRGQGIESIDMGGLRWVYVLEKEVHLLFIAAANKDEKAEMLRARLNVIKQSFFQEYVKDKDYWEKTWTGDIDMFKPFKNTIDEYYQNWLAAESVTTLAEFFDILGVFQQIFFDILSVIQHQLAELPKKSILTKMEKLFETYRNSDYIKNNPELEKITFSRDSGINIITINPNKCDTMVVEKQVINLMRRLVNMIKDEIGHEDSLKYFVQEGVFDYILNNISLLNQLNLDRFLLKLFLQE